MGFEDYIRESEKRQERLAKIAGQKRGCNLNNFLCEIYGGICRCIESCRQGWHWNEGGECC